ncbi:hypothetical protein [Sulfitobacter sp. R18_1]|uniref:hypothetical protein n=1 Tax=Sulfitobacter sp. R18_1 TaxID=2821104 RepID=UPI001ADA0762|nr:hypothetical protein [Sulfitobacter sp. R18_1]MBO9428056.1 hypothetical protein [Sulfitobacter sp. R18_1]
MSDQTDTGKPNSAWLPISEAPTDAEIVVGCYVEMKDGRYWSQWIVDPIDGEFGNDGYNGDSPTHWQYAPRDPEADQSINADERIQELERAVEAAEQRAVDAEHVLKAWFDLRKLGKEQVDEAVIASTKGYLRTSRSGGMDPDESDAVEAIITDMARLSIFADLYARIIQSDPTPLKERMAVAMCSGTVGVGNCTCAATGNFKCADEHPGKQAELAIAALAPKKD